MSDNWTEEELKAAVEAYVKMHSAQASGNSFIKKHVYQGLSRQFGRTEKSYEYRMQNISYLYSLMGRNWVSGLKPAKNVGAKTAAILERLIFEAEGQALTPTAEFESQVITYKSKKTLQRPIGVNKPEKSSSSVTQFTRDPKVKAWVLKQANGKCECCSGSAPFLTAEGEPYLEVHHLRRLADGGSDTVSNAVALCPNCHREIHYGIDKTTLVDSMYDKILRLVRE